MDFSVISNLISTYQSTTRYSSSVDPDIHFKFLALNTAIGVFLRGLNQSNTNKNNLVTAGIYTQSEEVSRRNNFTARDAVTKNDLETDNTYDSSEDFAREAVLNSVDFKQKLIKDFGANQGDTFLPFQPDVDATKLSSISEPVAKKMFGDSIVDSARSNMPSIQRLGEEPLKPFDFAKFQEETQETQLKTASLETSNNDAVLARVDDKGNITLSAEPKFPKAGEPVDGHQRDPSKGGTQDTSFWRLIPDTEGKQFFKCWTIGGKPYGATSIDNPLDKQLALENNANKYNTPGSVKFFIEKLHGRTSTGDFYRKNTIKELRGKKDAVDPKYSNRWVFPAYIQRYNDDYSVDWNSYKFIGRSEEVYHYSKTSRSLTLEFYIMADWSAELIHTALKRLEGGSTDISIPPSIKAAFYNSLPDRGLGTYPEPQYNYYDPNYDGRFGFVPGMRTYTPEMMHNAAIFLAQCAYPWYRRDGKMKEMPFVRMRIGDYIDVTAIVNKLSFSHDDFNMDMNASTIGNVPMGLNVTMDLTILHEEEPSSEYFKFYWRKDLDNKDWNYRPATWSESSVSKDAIIDNYTTGSPIKPYNGLTGPQSDKAVQAQLVAYQEALTSVDKNLINLMPSQSKVNGMKNVLEQKKIKDLLETSKKITDIERSLEVLGINPLEYIL